MCYLYLSKYEQEFKLYHDVIRLSLIYHAFMQWSIWDEEAQKRIRARNFVIRDYALKKNETGFYATCREIKTHDLNI